MSISSKRLLAVILAASAAVVGGWASVEPHSFFTTFPGFGHHWVRDLGPYNEHLTRDVGGLYLALLVVTVWSVVRGQTELLRLTGAAWLVFSVPHLLFHLDHLDGFTTFDKVGNIVALGGSAVLALLLLLPTRGD
jgi:hypothetical protein